MARSLEAARAADRAEIEQAQADNSVLRAMIAGLADEVRGHIAESRSSLDELGPIATAVAAGADQAEMLRLKVEGLAAQTRWDTQQLRQALDALLERMPLTNG